MKIKGNPLGIKATSKARKYNNQREVYKVKRTRINLYQSGRRNNIWTL